MILYIDTTASDLAQSAVASATDLTPADPGELVLGDSEPLTLYFLTAASTYAAWTILAGYTVTVALGLTTTDSTQDLASTTAFTDITNGFTGRLALTATALADAIACQLNKRPMQAGGWFALQIAVTDPTGHRETYATLPIFVRTSVL